jgi:CheY-like chemotaxis protein
MRIQDGSIEAQSAGLGLGATCIVRMPALPAVPPAVEPDAIDETQGGKGTSLAILLVEDHEDSATVIARIVRNLGHDVAVAHTVADALEKLRTQTFDLVLSDIGLPDGTGIELLAKSREFTRTPMIALTGYGMDDDLVKYRDAGFLHQLTKPIRFDQLKQLLQEFPSGRTQSGGLTVR